MFKAGKACNGYYTNEDVLTQANNTMNILDKHYPGHTHIFTYDNVTTHAKCWANAVSATYMVVNTPKAGKLNFLCTIKEKTGTKHTEWQVFMSNGEFPDGTAHSFYFPDNHQNSPSHFKGMQEIMWEQFDRGVPGVPNLNPLNGKKLNGECKNFKCAPVCTNCCLWCILYNQSDFTNQKSALEEICEVWGYWVLFFLKFHSEVNCIEQCWGLAKQVYHQFPASSAEADLKQNMLSALDVVLLTSIVGEYLYFC